MAEFGPETGAPGEGATGAPEQLSEEAKQRFAAAGAAMQAIQREEKRSKKRDSRVARTIIQFLNDDRYAHLFVLISRLVARDCPSIFILAILSLINDDCLAVVREYLQENNQAAALEPAADMQLTTRKSEIDAGTSRLIVEWITRLQAVLSMEPERILMKLMVDERNVDGTVLQLTTFVLQDFFLSERGGRKNLPFEQLHPLTASILQTVMGPFLGHVQRKFLEKAAAEGGEDSEET